MRARGPAPPARQGTPRPPLLLDRGGAVNRVVAVARGVATGGGAAAPRGSVAKLSWVTPRSAAGRAVAGAGRAHGAVRFGGASPCRARQPPAPARSRPP